LKNHFYFTFFLNISDPRVHDLPESVGDSFAQYHSLLPLELPGGALAPPPASSALKVMRGGPTNANATSGANSDSARARHGHVHTVYKVRLTCIFHSIL
jgi:hypothetical protein